MKLSHATVAVFAALALALAGCEKKEGPMEELGEKMDKAIDSDNETFENAGRATDEVVEDAKKKLEGDDE